jgi:hypothetical protein
LGQARHLAPVDAGGSRDAADQAVGRQALRQLSLLGRAHKGLLERLLDGGEGQPLGHGQVSQRRQHGLNGVEQSVLVGGGSLGGRSGHQTEGEKTCGLENVPFAHFRAVGRFVQALK